MVSLCPGGDWVMSPCLVPESLSAPAVMPFLSRLREKLRRRKTRRVRRSLDSSGVFVQREPELPPAPPPQPAPIEPKRKKTE